MTPASNLTKADIADAEKEIRSGLGYLCDLIDRALKTTDPRPLEQETRRILAVTETLQELHLRLDVLLDLHRRLKDTEGTD